MFCGKCGAEIPDGFEFCMKCGAKLSDSETVPVKPVQKREKKWLIPAILVIVVLAVGAGVFAWKTLAKEDGLYNDIAWGTSYEEVKEKLEDGNDSVYSTDTDSILEIVNDYDGVDNLTSLNSYYFDENGLYKVSISFVNTEEETGYTEQELYDKYVELYTEKYGEGLEEEALFQAQTTWETKKSNIEVSKILSSLDIRYEDINYTE